MKSQSHTQEPCQTERNPSEDYEKLASADERFRDAWHGGVYETEQKEEEGCAFDEIAHDDRN